MSMEHAEEDTCWICLEGGENLCSPCACPRVVHRNCLAKWQLHKAGSSEETHCRFCGSELGNWKTQLFPEVKMKSNSRPVMRFCLNGKVYYIVPKPGSDGLSEFKNTVRKLCNLSEDTQLDLSFQCSDPVEGNQLNLEGDGAYDAAVHCATVWAETRGSDDVPDNLIDTTDPSSLNGLSRTSRGQRSSSRATSSIMRRNTSGITDEITAEAPIGRVRIPGLLRIFSKKISVLTRSLRRSSSQPDVLHRNRSSDANSSARGF